MSEPTETSESTDAVLLRRAVSLAAASMAAGGGPFGAVVARDGEVVGEGTNRVTPDLDPSAHAEVVAIRDACRRLQTFDLSGCVVYASCEPCPMCLGAVLWARCDRLVFAATRGEAENAGFDDAAFYREFEAGPEGERCPRTRIDLPEARVVLAEWREKSDKTPY